MVSVTRPSETRQILQWVINTNLLFLLTRSLSTQRTISQRLLNVRSRRVVFFLLYRIQGKIFDFDYIKKEKKHKKTTNRIVIRIFQQKEFSCKVCSSQTKDYMKHLRRYAWHTSNTTEMKETSMKCSNDAECVNNSKQTINN